MGGTIEKQDNDKENDDKENNNVENTWIYINKYTFILTQKIKDKNMDRIHKQGFAI